MKKIKLDNYELKLIIYSLNELRNNLVAENKDFEIVDEVLMKYINVLNKQIKSKQHDYAIFLCLRYEMEVNKLNLKDIENRLKSIVKDNMAKIEYEEFKKKYKDNKRLMKKVDEYVEYIYPLYEYPEEIRKIIYTTNPIESLNSALRKVTRGKGSFINETALMKVLFLRVEDLQKKWCKGTRNWRNVQNQLGIIFEERYTQYI